MSNFFKLSVLILSLVIIITLFVGALGFHGVHASEQNDGAYRQMQVYSEVLKHVQTDYVTEPKMDQVSTGALHGLLESLDSDSSYLSPEEYKIYKDRQNSGTAQIGISVSKRYGYATIISVLPGTPAAKENLSDGDVIESIGSQSTRELSLAVIRLLLEGKPGSTLTLSVVRPRKAEPEKVTFTRAMIAVPPVDTQQYENSSILYLHPRELVADQVDVVLDRLKKMNAGGNKKILLDLRDVSEGDAAQAFRLANFFVRSGTLATLQGQKFPLQSFVADEKLFVTAAPLVVLVNHGTSGPGELAAAAILEAKRADLVGDKTFGSGSVQKTIEIDGGAAIILSVAKYASASGKKIDEVAVTPTVVVDSGAFSEDEEEPAKPVPSAGPKTDVQLNKALELLKQKAA
jgi:carboxyl-terminal processing protease